MHTLTAQDAAQLDALLPAALTQDMREVALSLFSALLDGGATAQHAARLVAAQVQRLSDELGGQSVYVPKGLLVRLAERDRAIYAAFTGTNYRQLAVAHNLTEVRVRQIIDACRRADFDARQQSLPL